jgi:hypothetical protein
MTPPPLPSPPLAKSAPKPRSTDFEVRLTHAVIRGLLVRKRGGPLVLFSVGITLRVMRHLAERDDYG